MYINKLSIVEKKGGRRDCESKGCNKKREENGAAFRQLCDVSKRETEREREPPPGARQRKGDPRGAFALPAQALTSVQPFKMPYHSRTSPERDLNAENAWKTIKSASFRRED